MYSWAIVYTISILACGAEILVARYTHTSRRMNLSIAGIVIYALMHGNILRENRIRYIFYTQGLSGHSNQVMMIIIYHHMNHRCGRQSDSDFSLFNSANLCLRHFWGNKSL